MLVPEVTKAMAIHDAKLSHRTTYIYKYRDTFVICAEGYTFPDEIKDKVVTVARIDRNGTYYDCNEEQHND